MTALEKVRDSNAWDSQYSLPLFPSFNNPWIYLAYTQRILRTNGEYIKFSDINKHFLRCEREPGYIQRWPGDNEMSHDELLGSAYLNPMFSARALDYLSENNGYYTKGKRKIWDNIYRFVFMLPALKAFANRPVNLFLQILLVFHIIWELFCVKRTQANDRLKLWLIYPSLQKLSLVGPVLRFWARIWAKRGVTPKSMFTTIYLTEVPVMGELAKDNYN